MSKSLDLKITVDGDGIDPDLVLHRIVSRRHLPGDALALLKYGTMMLAVTRIEQADGQDIGLEAEFEEYWRDSQLEGDEDNEDSKMWAHAAFMYGVKVGRARNQ